MSYNPTNQETPSSPGWKKTIFEQIKESDKSKLDQIPAWALEDHCDKNNGRLPLHIYQDYLDAIISDDHELVNMVLTVASSCYKNTLLNSEFDYEDDHLSKYNTYQFMRIRKPICLASVSASKQVIGVFIKHGIDINGRDCMDMNFIHLLISMAFYENKYEKKFTETYWYIMSILEVEDRKKLLRSENASGYRPLEFAAHHGTLTLMSAIMNTDGVYLRKVDKKGLCLYRWYDITAYESLSAGNRRHLSPIIALMMLDNKTLDHENTNQVFFKEPMCAWIEAKLQMNRPLILVWLILRLIHMSTFFLLDISLSLNEITLDGMHPTANLTSNSTLSYISDVITTTISTSPDAYRFCSFETHGIKFSSLTKNILRLYLVIHCSIVLLLDVLDHFRHVSADCQKNQITINGQQKDIVSHNRFYERAQRYFVLFVLIDQILKFMSIHTGTFPNLVRLVCMLLGPWPLLFFVQVLPSIGYFVTAIQRMLQQLMDFGVVYMMFMAGFTHGFYVIVNSSLRTNCEQDDFRNLFSAAYTTFNIMLNMVDVQAFKIVEPTSFFLFHIAYTFLVGILLINFLIAIMSSAMTTVAEHKPTILIIQRLSVCFAIERRICNLVKTYYFYWNRKKFVYGKDGRIFLVRATPICNASCMR